MPPRHVVVPHTFRRPPADRDTFRDPNTTSWRVTPADGGMRIYAISQFAHLGTLVTGLGGGSAQSDPDVTRVSAGTRVQLQQLHLQADAFLGYSSGGAALRLTVFWITRNLDFTVRVDTVATRMDLGSVYAPIFGPAHIF